LWGSIPEIKILANYYSKQICVVDLVTKRIFKYGGGDKMKEKIFLLFNGTYYGLGVKINMEHKEAIC